MVKEKKQSFFTRQLLRWNKLKNKRNMPWKGEKDPYKIWLSEVILQQTRVEQGWAYYERFIKAFPTIKHLASAPDDKVMKLWEGLGYYSRCRNLLASARLIVKQYKGKFPTDYETIIQLKGIGTYTAAAISSFAYNLPYAVVDGNVMRVLARYFGEPNPIDDPVIKQKLHLFAQQLLNLKNPGIYNQAIMDFGATVCKPKAPTCESCFLHTYCEAYKQNKTNIWPIKSKSIQKKSRFFTYFILNYKDQICITQRTKKDIWQDLYQFYLHENDIKTIWNNQSIEKFVFDTFKLKLFTITNITAWYSQTLTHQEIQAIFIAINCIKKPTIQQSHQWIKSKALKNFTFPKIINTYLQAKAVQISFW